MGTGDKADYFRAKGVIAFIKKDNCMYKACQSPDCSKKVIEVGVMQRSWHSTRPKHCIRPDPTLHLRTSTHVQDNGKFRCEKCQKDHDSFKWRLMVTMNIADATGSTWVTAFQVQRLRHTSIDVVGSSGGSLRQVGRGTGLHEGQCAYCWSLGLNFIFSPYRTLPGVSPTISLTPAHHENTTFGVALHSLTRRTRPPLMRWCATLC